LELLNILANLKIAENCEKVVHGMSNMVELIIHATEVAHNSAMATIKIGADVDVKKAKTGGNKFIKVKLEGGRNKSKSASHST
jgi:hypothetical protein